MSNIKFEIRNGDINTGKLTLTNGGNAKMNSKHSDRKIKWKIVGGDNPVVSFRLESKDGTSPPFDVPPPITYEGKVKLEVIKDQPYTDWNYTIKWKDNLGGDHTHDPLIAIRPSFNTGFLPIPVISGVLIGLGIIGVSLLFLKWNEKWRNY